MQAILLVTCGLTAHVDYLCCCRIKYVKDLCRKECLIALASSLHCKDTTKVLITKHWFLFCSRFICMSLIISYKKVLSTIGR
nr:MAG TPA: hypothetical protein [Caudoviricetes sp.]